MKEKNQNRNKNFYDLTDDEVEFLDNIDISGSVIIALIFPGLFLLFKGKLMRLLLSIVVSFALFFLWGLFEILLQKLGININPEKEYIAMVAIKQIVFCFFALFKIRKILWTSGKFDKALMEYRDNKLKSKDNNENF